MTTETTSQLPPCPLPDCEGGEHHYHDFEVYTIGEGGHSCASIARSGFCCYSQHRPQSPQWQPIECDQIRAGMRIMATTIYPDYATIHIGVAHRTGEDGDWLTERAGLLTGWIDPTTYEVDPATIPDPDAETVEIIAELLHAGDPGSLDMWGELTERERQNYRDQAREVIAAVRAHDEAV